jgi:2-phosphosulfolactate phosphatase
MQETSALPALYTTLSPSLLSLYDISNSVVVIIDVLRATSTIAAALNNGAREVVPVDSVSECIKIGKQMEAITAGERDGKVAEGLQHGNSPFEYPPSFISGKTLVLTTTNGTKLLHMALQRNASEIITGSFANIDAVCEYLTASGKPVLLACAGWKDRINMEDTMFAGAVIDKIGDRFNIACDASKMALGLYRNAQPDLFGFMQQQQASHYLRLSSFGLEKDIRHCLTPNTANVLPIYKNGKLVLQ